MTSQRAAFVRGLCVAVAVVASSAITSAQTTAHEPWAITDNSFFVEEAFNQERGVVQNIFVWEKVRGGGWDGSFTQEWPAPAMRHQLSYTVPFDGGANGAHVGSILVNYRLQVLEEGPGRPAFSPRLSIMLPSGRAEDFGDRAGYQVNLPFSKQLGDIYLHGNAGFTQLLHVPLGASQTTLTSPLLAGSVIWRLKPMVNLMLESAIEFADGIDGPATTRQRSVLVSPGLRTGWNFGEKQFVIGAAVPVTTSAGESSVAVLTYLSYELPFLKTR